LAALEDSSFKSLPTLRTYFNAPRLTIFAKNITALAATDMKEVTKDAALQRNPTAKAYDFMMTYTLKSDTKEYREPWRAYTVVKGSATVINGFVYQGTGISQSPFFQFTKYGIK
jgi:hypothetical protein